MNAESIQKAVAGRRPCTRIPITCAADLQWYGQMAAASQMFGAISPPEGVMICGICHQVGISWLEFAETFNIMHHRISKKTDAILADFQERGGVYEIVSRTEDKAEAKFSFGKTKYTSTVKWDDCLTEPFIYQGKEEAIVNSIVANNTAALVMKPKYRTKRSRMQMMWARCVSDGVRVVCPAACQGVYTPEEIEDIAEYDMPAAGVATSMMPPAAAPAPAPAPAAAPAEQENVEICSVGTMAGKRWDSMDDATLNLALQAAFPQSVKDYISKILESRRANAAQSTTQTTQN